MSSWPQLAAPFDSHKSIWAYEAALKEATSEQRRARTQWKVRVLTLLEPTERLFMAFHERGIPFTVVKGLALAREVYPDPFSRPYSDLDLLVPLGYFGIAAETLLGMGYGFAPYEVKQSKHYQLVQRGWPTVDLHHGLSRDFQDPPELLHALTTRTRSLPFGETTFYTPTPPLHSAYVLLHARNHSFLHKPSWVLDLALLERHTPGCVRRAHELLTSLGVGEASSLGLSLLPVLLKTKPPPPAEEIVLTKKLVLLQKLLLSTLKSGRSPFLSSLLLRASLKKSLKDNVLWVAQRF